MNDKRTTLTTICHCYDGVRECVFPEHCAHKNSTRGAGASEQRHCSCPKYSVAEWAILSELRLIRAALESK